MTRELQRLEDIGSYQSVMDVQVIRFEIMAFGHLQYFTSVNVMMPSCYKILSVLGEFRILF